MRRAPDYLVGLCMCEPFPDQTRAAVVEACRKRTWGILSPEKLEALADQVLSKIAAPDLSYLAFKTETGENDFAIYKELILKRRNISTANIPSEITNIAE